MNLTEPLDTETPPEPQHVDDFISYGTTFSKRKQPLNEDYARWVLNHFRLSAICRSAFDQFMVEHKLFATCEGKRYRVTGASRLGDVWLAKNFNRDSGYDHRVRVDYLSDWGKEP